MIKKLDMSGISAAPKSARSAHPIVTVDSETESLLEQFVVINPQFKTLKNQSETISKQLAPRIKDVFFHKYAGVAPESSTMLVRVGASTVKLTVKNAYSSMCSDEAALVKAIGAELAAEHFRQATTISLDLDKVPDSKQEEFAARVIAIAQELEVTDAVSAKQCIKPKAGFHEARTSLLSPEQNLALDSVLPITAYPQL